MNYPKTVATIIGFSGLSQNLEGIGYILQDGYTKLYKGVVYGYPLARFAVPMCSPEFPTINDVCCWCKYN